jgi:hypothetical protein
MKTIYILTQGEYSDHHIIATYSTRELAEEAQRLCLCSEIEEYELDALKMPEHPPGHSAWGVNISLKTNTITHAYMEDVTNGHFEPGGIYHNTPEWTFKTKYDPLYVVNCWARGKEHAEKIALDKYHQWKWEKENEVAQ